MACKAWSPTHPHAKLLKTLLPCLPYLNKTIDFCESCVLGKSTKHPFNSRFTYTSSFLQTIHTDLWGPASVTSYDGYRYYLVLIDESTKYVWQFPMARKSDVATIFPTFIKFLENQF